jgi:DNA-binding MarR family transcriptional regulator
MLLSAHFINPTSSMAGHMANILQRSPIHLLHRAIQAADSAFLAKISGLTSRQLAILEGVAAHDGASQTILTQITGIDRTTTAHLVKRLTRKGLLRRRRTSADARAYAVRLTAEGRHVLRESRPIVKAVDEHVLATLPEARREPFLGSLQSVIEALERPRGSRLQAIATTTLRMSRTSAE